MQPTTRTEQEANGQAPLGGAADVHEADAPAEAGAGHAEARGEGEDAEGENDVGGKSRQAEEDGRLFRLYYK